MTTNATLNKFRYQGNGVTTAFLFSGRLFSYSDLIVEIIDRATDTLISTVTISSGMVVINGPESATVTLATAPTSTQDVLVRRAISITQSLDLPTGTVFPAEKVENALDKTIVAVQDLAEVVSRSITIPVTSMELPPDIFSLAEAVEDNAAQTALDRIQTGLDRVQTGADRVQTGLDVVSANASAASASTSATLAASTFTATSTTSNTVGTGAKSFTVQTNKAFQAGQYVVASNGVNSMAGSITSYNNSTGALVLAISSTSGSGTFTSWNIGLSGQPGASGTGSGTVLSVAVTTANGVSGTVANPTSTPAISLTLGAITPSSVVASGSVTGSNLSGTNTGDQTNITGNAGTATKLATARNINSVAFDGTSDITITATQSTAFGAIGLPAMLQNVSGGTIAGGATITATTTNLYYSRFNSGGVITNTSGSRPTNGTVWRNNCGESIGNNEFGVFVRVS